MKDVRYIRKEKGVSPVIATILMVAITVVLAATVYIMVSGLGTTTTQQITGNFASKEMVDSDTWKLTFSTFNPETSIKNLKISISDGTNTATVQFSDDSNGASQTASLGSATITIYYYDLADNHKINTGDYLLIDGVSTGTTYTVTILDSEGNQICSVSFTA